MRVFIGFEAPQSLRQLHEEMQPNLCRYLGGRHPTQHQPLHLTVKSPFDADQVLLESIVKNLEAVAEYERPFDVRVRPASHFDQQCIHYPLDGAVLRDMLQQVLAVLEDRGIPPGELDGKTPHVTLVSASMSPKEFERAFALCRDVRKHRSAVLDTLVVYERQAERWVPWWKIPLRGGK